MYIPTCPFFSLVSSNWIRITTTLNLRPARLTVNQDPCSLSISSNLARKYYFNNTVIGCLWCDATMFSYSFLVELKLKYNALLKSKYCNQEASLFLFLNLILNIL